MPDKPVPKWDTVAKREQNRHSAIMREREKNRAIDCLSEMTPVMAKIARARAQDYTASPKNVSNLTKIGYETVLKYFYSPEVTKYVSQFVEDENLRLRRMRALADTVLENEMTHHGKHSVDVAKFVAKQKYDAPELTQVNIVVPSPDDLVQKLRELALPVFEDVTPKENQTVTTPVVIPHKS